MTNCRDPEQLNMSSYNFLTIKRLIKHYDFRMIKLNEKFRILYRPTEQFIPYTCRLVLFG
jgi:hypothetical protein